MLYTVKPVLREYCYERPPVLKDQIFLSECSNFSVIEPVTKDHLSRETIFVWPMGWSFKTGSTVHPSIIEVIVDFYTPAYFKPLSISTPWELHFCVSPIYSAYLHVYLPHFKYSVLCNYTNLYWHDIYLIFLTIIWLFQGSLSHKINYKGQFHKKKYLQPNSDLIKVWKMQWLPRWLVNLFKNIYRLKNFPETGPFSLELDLIIIMINMQFV